MESIYKKREKESALCFIITVKYIKAFGKIIYAMDKAMNHLQMDVSLRGNTKIIKCTDLADMCGRMEIFIKDNSKTMLKLVSLK